MEMIKSKDIHRLLEHPAIMQQRTLIEVIKRNTGQTVSVSVWASNNFIPEVWVARLNKIKCLAELDLNVNYRDELSVKSMDELKQLAAHRFNAFVSGNNMQKKELAERLGMLGDTGQGVQRWKHTGVSTVNVVKFCEEFGGTVELWRPDLGSLRFSDE
jgi:hypothetical protein